MNTTTQMMGWSSRFCFGTGVTEADLLKTAEALTEKGLAKAGYRCLLIYDGWALPERDADGRLAADPVKFPRGIKATADRLHEMGFSLGLYAGSGAMTPAGCPGSYRHEITDAETFGAWDVDYIEYDGVCSADPGNLKYRFRTFAFAMGAKAPEVRYGFSFRGDAEPLCWAPETCAVSCCPDDTLCLDRESIKNAILSAASETAHNRRGCYHRLCDLTVGEKTEGGLCLADARVQFSFWCAYGSPLWIGGDVCRLTEEEVALLSDPKLLRIQRDSAYRQPIVTLNDGNQVVMARFLDDEKIALGFFSMYTDGEGQRDVPVAAEDLGVPVASGRTLLVHTPDGNADRIAENGIFSLSVDSFGAGVCTAVIVDKDRQTPAECPRMKKPTPAMGWNSWNTFGAAVCEQVIVETADAIVEKGLDKCGYEYVVIDDCWSLHERDENGRLVADPEKFPHGMKWLADYVHSKGLKFGIYSCAGPLTCAGYPGSLDYEFTDAETFAAWGVDYLKYDYCWHSKNVYGETAYLRMGAALKKTGRDILFSACSWGIDETKKWVKKTGADLFRSTGDIHDSFESVRGIVMQEIKDVTYNGQGCFNDLDMLIVGMEGKGNVGAGGCTYDEYLLHFAFWCLFGSPLMIGCDLRTVSDEALAILKNPDLIRINQDPGAHQPFFIEQNYDFCTEAPIMARFLEDGTVVVGIFNFTKQDRCGWGSSFLSEKLGLPEPAGKLHLKELFTGEETDSWNGLVNLKVPSHSARVYIASLK